MLRNKLLLAGIIGLTAWTSNLSAQELDASIEKIAEKGLAFLSKSQDKNGTFSPRAGSGSRSPSRWMEAA